MCSIKMGRDTKRDPPVAVIRGAPNGDDFLVKHELVTLHDELMCSRDQVEVVGVDKLLDDVGAKEVARSSRREAPAFDVYGEARHTRQLRGLIAAAHSAQGALSKRGKAGGREGALEAGLTIWIRPQQVTHCTVVRHLLLPVD